MTVSVLWSRGSGVNPRGQGPTSPIGTIGGSVTGSLAAASSPRRGSGATAGPERTITWFGGYCRLAIRYERHGHRFAAFFALAAAITCNKKLAN